MIKYLLIIYLSTDILSYYSAVNKIKHRRNCKILTILSRTYQNSLTSGFDVIFSVPHHKTVFKVNIEIPGSLQKHTRFQLAALTVKFQLWYFSFISFMQMKRTEIYAVCQFKFILISKKPHIFVDRTVTIQKWLSAFQRGCSSL